MLPPSSRFSLTPPRARLAPCGSTEIVRLANSLPGISPFPQRSLLDLTFHRVSPLRNSYAFLMHEDYTFLYLTCCFKHVRRSTIKRVRSPLGRSSN